MTFPRSLEHGTVLLGKYRIDSIIGRGGMGLVVKAWHLGLEEEVAIKMLRDDVPIAEETIARFVREAQAAVKLKSEHIARITDVGTFHDGKPYMVMELLEGQDIGQLLTERGRLQPSLAIDLVIQACEALAEAHSLGIVHRDIKPTNLFLTSRPDGSLLLKVLDFGISKSPAGAELSLTQTWSMLGSPAYMSPEQMRSARHVDGRTDVWSLGAVLYEVLEGHLPFQAGSFSEMCIMVAVDPPAPMHATPPELAAIIARCLAKHPDARYANVAELGRDLARLAREPDKAQVLVDRMYRVLGRGTIRRTPVAGVPQVAMRAPTHGDPTPSGGTPRSLPHVGSSGIAVSPPATLPRAIARTPGAAANERLSAPSYPLPLPAPLLGDARYLRPGLQLPRGAPSLTATHVIAPPVRGWALAVITAVVALAAAVGAIAATRSSNPVVPTAPDEPTIVRMHAINPSAAPSAGSGQPSPTPAAPSTTVQ